MYPIDFFWRATRRWPTRIAPTRPMELYVTTNSGSKLRRWPQPFRKSIRTCRAHVGICAGNSTEHLIALLAVLASGKVWVPLNPRSTQPEIQRIVDTTQPTILVVDTAYVDLVADATAS